MPIDVLSSSGHDAFGGGRQGRVKAECLLESACEVLNLLGGLHRDVGRLCEGRADLTTELVEGRRVC